MLYTMENKVLLFLFGLCGFPSTSKLTLNSLQLKANCLPEAPYYVVGPNSLSRCTHASQCTKQKL